MLLSAIVPVYNEENNLQELYERLKTTFAKAGVSYEIIFVNDGSRDNSIKIIRELATSDNSVKFINFSRNFGHQIALSAGLDKCRGDAVVIIDADLQDPPELIAEMFEKYKEGYKVVYAKRRSRVGESWFKKTTAKLFYRILKKLTHTKIPVDVGDFRLIDKEVVRYIRKMREPNKFLRGQIAWMGFQQTWVEYDRQERKSGSTGYSFRKMLRLALDGIVGFSDAPLKFATLAGFAVFFLSLLIILYALYSHFILHRTITGWTSIIISTMFIGGIQLLSIGIIGEYISRIFHNVRNRPLYIIDETNIIDEPSENKEST